MRTIIATCLFVIGIATSASAQTDSKEDVLAAIETCRGISILEVRQACMNAADTVLKRLDQSATGPQSPQPPIRAETSPAPRAIQQAELDLEAERAALAKERAELEEERAALEAKSDDASENERLGMLARLGLARNAENKNEEISATLTITRAKSNRQRLYTLWTSDGDVLVQQSGGRSLRLPDTLPATATLERRTFGSKWITFTENPKRSYKVKVLPGK